ASSVAEAFEVLDTWMPDVLISDIGMPGENGFDLIRKLRSRGSEMGGGIPALALSGYAGSAEGEAALAAGYQMRLTKPVELKALEQAVISLVEKCQNKDAYTA